MLLAAFYLLQDLVGAVEALAACVPDLLNQLLRGSVALDAIMLFSASRELAASWPIK